MNRWIGMGRLTRDPDIRYSGDMTVARFTLAVDRKFKKEGEASADFISCVAFRKTAEIIEKHCRQGSKIVIEGRIQTSSYTNKDGHKVYTTDIVVESMEFADSKAASASQPQQSQSRSPYPTDSDGFMNIPDGVDDEALPWT